MYLGYSLEVVAQFINYESQWASVIRISIF